jgi:hypothetical protein
MSTLKTTFIQHPAAGTPAIELESDGTVLIPSIPPPDLSNLNADNLTSGTVPSARIDGSGITGLNATNLSSGTVAGARLPSGTTLQVVHVIKTNSFSTSSTSFTPITGLSASITPSSASSKIFVTISVMLRNRWIGELIVKRGATILDRGNSSGAFKVQGQYNGFAQDRLNTETSGFILDSPNTTSALTYSIETRTTNGTYPSTINLDNNGTLSVSSITLMEIAG